MTYVAFAYGCVVMGLAVARAREIRPRVSAAGLFAVTTVMALSLPAIEFPDETLSGFRGLDLLSVIAAVGLAAAVVAVESLRVTAALCLTGILGGNVLIQHFTTRGSIDRYGLVVATGAAAASLLCALVGVRGSAGGRR